MALAEWEKLAGAEETPPLTPFLCPNKCPTCEFRKNPSQKTIYACKLVRLENGYLKTPEITGAGDELDCKDYHKEEKPNLMQGVSHVYNGLRYENWHVGSNRGRKERVLLPKPF